MAYNYLEAVKDDVKQAIEDNYNVADYPDRDEFEQTLNEPPFFKTDCLFKAY